MKKEDIIPYTNKFITVTLADGSQHSGYISNPKDFEIGIIENPVLKLINGFFTEDVDISNIVTLSVADRMDTVSIPVIDLKSGYEVEDDTDRKLDEMFTDAIENKDGM